MLQSVFRGSRRCLVTSHVPKSNYRTEYHETEALRRLERIRQDLVTRSFAPGTTQKVVLAAELSKVDKAALKAERTQEIVEQLLDAMSGKEMDFKSCRIVDEIMMMMGINKMYHEKSFDFLASTLKSTSSELVMQHVTPAFLGLCSRVRYYEPSLLNMAGGYAIDNMEDLHHTKLSVLIYSMGQLYHPFPTLYSKLEKYLLAHNTYLKVKRLSWMFIWSGMVHSIYPKDLLALMLEDSYIKDNLGFVAITLLQLRISLNKECPHLKLGTGWDSTEELQRWGLCRSGIKGTSRELMRAAFTIRISRVDKLKKSIFGANIHRALRSCLGDVKCFQSDPLSLSGYNFDFEILLDRNGNLINIPMVWKFKSKVLLNASVGVKEDVNEIKQYHKRKTLILGNVIDSMKESEEDITSFGNFDVKLSEMILDRGKKNMNIASDWGRKFGSYPHNISRKILIEANGPLHYASNCNHSLGYTRLKERHIRTLGWELISIDYKDWEKLGTGDEHAAHLLSLIHSKPKE